MLPILWILFCVVGRIIPHPANCTPMTNLCLFAGAKISRAWALVVSLLALAVSDVLLALGSNHPIFSMWSLFTYSGFAGIVLFGSLLARKNSLRVNLLGVLASGMGFWVWTNFGVWLTSALYAQSFSGLLACYVAALPFLRNALCGDLVWFVLVFGAFKLFESRRSVSSRKCPVFVDKDS